MLCWVAAPPAASAQESDAAPAEPDAGAPPAASEHDIDGEASAEADPVALARAAFAEGVSCVEARDFACAARHFRAAMELRDAPAVRYNLASALVELERYPEAGRLARSALEDPETPDTVREHTRTLLEQLDARAGRLAFVVTGAPEGAVVRVDGEAVDASEGAETHVGPGARTVTVHDAERELARRTVEVEVGARRVVELSVAPPPEAVAEAAVAPATESEPTPEPPLAEDWRFWVAVAGAVVVITVVAVVVGVAATEPVEPIQGDYVPGVIRWD